MTLKYRRTATRFQGDRPRQPARFLILGSASPNLLRQSSESLPGRIFYHELEGFSIEEVGNRGTGQLWLRGGFPRSFLASPDHAAILVIGDSSGPT
jgi:predicted AAA+ superfamily ATPase